MNRPEYQYFSPFAKISYYFSRYKIDFKEVQNSNSSELHIDFNAIIKDQNNLSIYLKKGCNLITSNLSNTVIHAEKETNVFIFNSFSGSIQSKSYVSLQKKSQIKANISCAQIEVCKALFNTKRNPSVEGKITLTKVQEE